MASRALIAVVAAALAAAGCAHAPAATAPAPDWGIAHASTTDTFEIGGQADHWGVRVTDDQILGVQPDFALARTDGEIRGRAMGVPVVVGFHEDEGVGVYRGAPFQVKVERTPAGLRVNGLFGGAISNFELSTDRINGRIGTLRLGRPLERQRLLGEPRLWHTHRADFGVAPGDDGPLVGRGGRRGAGTPHERRYTDGRRPAGGQLGRVPRPARPRAAPYYRLAALTRPSVVECRARGPRSPGTAVTGAPAPRRSTGRRRR